MLFEALPCSLVRVFSDHLDPTKTWYLYDEKVWQVPRRKIKDSAIHRAFPCEFAFDMNVSVLLGEGGSSLSIDPASRKARGKIDVASSFSLLVALLRTKELSSWSAGVHSKHVIEKGASIVNIIDFSKSFDFGARAKYGASAVTEAEVDDPPANFGDFKPICSSSPKEQRHGIVKNIEALEGNEKLTTSYKKRRVQKLSESIFEDVRNICTKHNEKLETVISNFCLNDSFSRP